MTTPISPEAQALLDAALAYKPEIVAGSHLRYQKLNEAIDSYRTSLAPKECRPEKAGTYWLKRSDGMMCVGSFEPIADPEYAWSVLGHGEFSTQHAAAHGWTVHSACTFPGERVEATEREVFYLAQYCGFAIPAIGGGTKYKFKNTPELLAYTQAALRHFFPTLRPVSDEKIEEIWDSLGMNSRISKQEGAPPMMLANILEFVRAVQAFERGTG